MRRLLLSFFILGFLCFSIIFFSSWTYGESKTKASCITGSCHAQMGKEKYVHGPVAVMDCFFCHKEIGKHKFAPIKEVRSLCYNCHDPVDTKNAVHQPVKEGNCTKCHNPHQSPNKFMLISYGAELCFKCHARNSVEGKFLHGPVAVGDCTACHGVHQGDYPKLLAIPAKDLCYTCHTEKKDAFTKKKVVHKPVYENCLLCHNVHAANFAFLLKNEGKSLLCYDCHRKMKDQIANVKIAHKALQGEKGCLACHLPHATDFPKILAKEPMALCLSCHDRSYGAGKRAIVNIKQVIAEGKFKHGPIRENDCSSCHEPHGSDNFQMLRKYFPLLFYTSFKEENYALCFSCHQRTLALDRKTTTLTGFRNGDDNLHFVHVNKVDKGRTCRACHEPHANNNPNHVRNAVPFGAWQIPINYKKTVDGGSCAPGCHREYSYSRKNPVKYQ